MKNYTWTVNNLYTENKDGYTNYVVDAIYTVEGSEESGGTTYTAEIQNTATFEVVQGDNFVPYADLTNAIVIGWIQDQLGTDGVNNLQSTVGGMIDTQINPPTFPVNTPLPF